MQQLDNYDKLSVTSWTLKLPQAHTKHPLSY